MEPSIYIILFVLRIVGVYVCVATAKELNRSSRGWGFFGFLSPFIAMIWINCLKPVTH